MNDAARQVDTGPLAALARVRRRVDEPRRRPGERCDMCGNPVAAEHEHVVNVEARSLLCSCRGCWLLFTAEGAGGGHFRGVPDRFLAFTDFALSPAQWDALQIPVSVAFFFRNSTLDRVCAFYPSPAGATESLLDLAAWDGLVTANPELATLAPDVEAFLVRVDPRSANAPECYLVPIDACYELVGQLRRTWRGFDGGSDAHAAMNEFFADVRARAGVEV